ncbi:MAG: hypothetical protein AB1393_03810 [Candidatus Edwardsbacteria bacterium]
MYKKICWILLVAVCLLFSGCWNPFSPPRATSKKPVFLDRSTPEGLLFALVYTYNHKDIDGYLACLADSFRFEFARTDSSYLWEQGIFQLWWGKDKEELATRNLFIERQSIELTLATTSWYKWQSDTTIQWTRRYYTLSLDGSPPDEISGYATFFVKQGTDLLWQIIRWVDEAKL